MSNKFLTEDRVKELWTAVATKISTTVASELEEYATNEGVGTAIATALANYMTADDTRKEIAAAVVASSSLKIEVVDALPPVDEAEENAIYFVPARSYDLDIRIGSADGDMLLVSNLPGDTDDTRLVTYVYELTIPDGETKVKVYANAPGSIVSSVVRANTTIDTLVKDLQVVLVNQGIKLFINEDDGYIYYYRNSENVREEYMLVNGAFELLGSTEIDLANYWSKNDLQPMTAKELSEILT